MQWTHLSDILNCETDIFGETTIGIFLKAMETTDMNKPEIENRRRDKRESFSSEIDLLIEPHNLDAVSFDISENGLRFENGKPIKAKVRLDYGDQMIEREMYLVWAKRENGRMSYGFEHNPDSKGWSY